MDSGRLGRLAARALGMLRLGEAHVSVTVVSDRRMRELNRRYRGVDAPTDVLAFSQREGEGVSASPEVLDPATMPTRAAPWRAIASRTESWIASNAASAIWLLRQA